MIESFYLLLPAGFANMAPVLFRNFEFLNTPVDFGKKLYDHRIFGANKTWRGILLGITIGIAIALAQKLLLPYLGSITLIKDDFLMFGLISGLGAMFGDLAGSFFKRRLDIKPGKNIMFLDQLDWVIGAFILMPLVYIPSLEIVVEAIIIFFIIHVTVKAIGRKLGF